MVVVKIVETLQARGSAKDEGVERRLMEMHERLETIENKDFVTGCVQKTGSESAQVAVFSAVSSASCAAPLGHGDTRTSKGTSKKVKQQTPAAHAAVESPTASSSKRPSPILTSAAGAESTSSEFA